MDDLKRTGMVVAFDFLGFGLSDKPKHHNYTLMEQTDITVSLLSHLSLQSIHILAHDYGVSVGQELLARDAEKNLPFRIQSTVFLNGGLLPHAHRPVLMQHLLQSHVFGPLLSHAVNYYSFRGSFRAVFGTHTAPSEEELRVIWAFIQKEDGHLLAHKLLQYMPERRHFAERWVFLRRFCFLSLKWCSFFWFVGHFFLVFLLQRYYFVSDFIVFQMIIL